MKSGFIPLFVGFQFPSTLTSANDLYAEHIGHWEVFNAA